MNKPLKIIRFAILALTVAAGLGIGHAYAGTASPAGEGALHELLRITCLYCR